MVWNLKNNGFALPRTEIENCKMAQTYHLVHWNQINGIAESVSELTFKFNSIQKTKIVH